jgi:hypothetical protein
MMNSSRALGTFALPGILAANSQATAVRGCLTLAAMVMIAAHGKAHDAPRVSMQMGLGHLRISIGAEPFATYVFDDPTITRPHFANVHSPSGIQTTRNQPPVAGDDLMDHPTFHPGIWLAFGDVSGADNWRLAATVRNVGVDVQAIEGDGSRGTFTARHQYLPNDGDGAPICEELFRCTICVTLAGHLIVWDSTFSSNREFHFGDQEEMGLGFRVATRLRAQRDAEVGAPGGTGEIRDAEGRNNEAEVWGNSAAWCDYSGEMEALRVGMTIFCHPDNFRASWFHARDRGLLVANPFGRAAFHKGVPSKVLVKPGESLRLRYGILVHSGPKDKRPDLDAAYREYVELTRER